MHIREHVHNILPQREKNLYIHTIEYTSADIKEMKFSDGLMKWDKTIIKENCMLSLICGC